MTLTMLILITDTCVNACVKVFQLCNALCMSSYKFGYVCRVDKTKKQGAAVDSQVAVVGIYHVTYMVHKRMNMHIAADASLNLDRQLSLT